MKLYLTTKGKNLLSKVQGSLATIKFTKISLGNGAIDVSNIEEKEQLVNPILDLEIVNIGVKDSNVIATGLIDNSTFSGSLVYGEIGLFAKNGEEEILYIYGNGTNETIPPKEEELVQVYINIPVGLSNTDKVEMVVQPIWNAININFDETSSTLSSSNVQNAIEEINYKVDNMDLSKYAEKTDIKPWLRTDVKDTARAGLNVNGGLSFEDNKHNITYNDGGGNFNIRIGHNASEITEPGIPLHMRFSQDSGGLEFLANTTAQNVGEVPKLNPVLQISPNCFAYKGQNIAVNNGVLQTGLNADKLDGKDATAFAPAGYGLGGAAGFAYGDWNDYTATGFYQGDNMVNAPPVIDGAHTWMFVIVMKHNDLHAMQRAVDFNNAATWQRIQTNGTWCPWKRIDGGGSVIKSVQRGIIYLSGISAGGTITIGAVNPGKTIVNFLGNVTTSDINSSTNVWLRLTSATTLECARNSHGGANNTSYEVIEYV